MMATAFIFGLITILFLGAIQACFKIADMADSTMERVLAYLSACIVSGGIIGLWVYYFSL